MAKNKNNELVNGTNSHKIFVSSSRGLLLMHTLPKV